MKRLLIGFVVFFTLSSTALAASQWGAYKGNPILKLTSDGQPLTVTDVPAMNFMNRTVVPVYLLRQIGLEVNYDARTQTVDVKLPEQPEQPVQEGLSLAELNEIGRSVGIVYAYSDQTYVGQGSAFVVNDILVSNAHVIEKATRIIVAFGKDEKTFQVKDALFRNDKADLVGFAISGVPSLKLSTIELKSGDRVYSLGYPGRKFQISEGEYVTSVPQVGIFSHTADTMPGSSGGIATNKNGEVIGITSGGGSAQDKSVDTAIMASVLQEELNKLK